MFNNLMNLNNGKTTGKVLATLLVMTLTFANFAMLRNKYRRNVFITCSRC